MKFTPVLLLLFASVSLAAPAGLDGADIEAKPDNTHATREKHAGVIGDDAHITRENHAGVSPDDSHMTIGDSHATFIPDENDAEASPNDAHATRDDSHASR
ncbi:hypothetical protein VE01_02738 [Pseudogymnoascus verrucosus]|uniref:Uncharacterized protein n=1 Tax=Pseudogymnoascus verrucosus TaxID=342668 RepID=A0A1B8GU47_9PEZI|nr:uncharacterized protein VE01_02738 [Pseudogymnoascus verrucosus]OBT99364.1 hypothetical protein VE01_02738 [Pseudogymnoascus verrucosus]